MNDRSIAISSPPLAPTIASATSARVKSAQQAGAARTKLLLEGPILPTLLRLSVPNILNLLAFAGMITFDGFFLANSVPTRSPVHHWHFRSS